MYTHRKLPKESENQNLKSNFCLSSAYTVKKKVHDDCTDLFSCFN